MPTANADDGMAGASPTDAEIAATRAELVALRAEHVADYDAARAAFTTARAALTKRTGTVAAVAAAQSAVAVYAEMIREVDAEVAAIEAEQERRAAAAAVAARWELIRTYIDQADAAFAAEVAARDQAVDAVDAYAVAQITLERQRYAARTRCVALMARGPGGPLTWDHVQARGIDAGVIASGWEHPTPPGGAYLSAPPSPWIPPKPPHRGDVGTALDAYVTAERKRRAAMGERDTPRVD